MTDYKKVYNEAKKLSNNEIKTELHKILFFSHKANRLPSKYRKYFGVEYDSDYTPKEINYISINKDISDSQKLFIGIIKVFMDNLLNGKYFYTDKEMIDIYKKINDIYANMLLVLYLHSRNDTYTQIRKKDRLTFKILGHFLEMKQEVLKIHNQKDTEKKIQTKKIKIKKLIQFLKDNQK